ncbi:MAG: hypothetical protein GX025_03505 [Clostridiales bacterium]|jgi:hypothetical protein|nr:hypothetical protein [Clostridiales bacterium]
MWISERAAQSGKFENYDIALGNVSHGGMKLGVEVNGEQRSARLVSAGAVYVPEVEDEVLVLKDSEGESFVLGKVQETASSEVLGGELLISLGKGSFIRLKKNGDLELFGEVFLKGTTHIDGKLYINGVNWGPPSPEEE